MLNIKTIQVKAFLLLFVYLASNMPISFFHTHKNEKISFEKASACEKKIYYSEVDGDCEHDTHISKQTEKCSLCESHFAKPYTTFELNFSFSKKTFANQYKIDYVYLVSYNPSSHSNKGPPAII